LHCPCTKTIYRKDNDLKAVISPANKLNVFENIYKDSDELMRETLTDSMAFKDYLAASAGMGSAGKSNSNVKSDPGGECGQEPENVKENCSCIGH